MLVFAYLALSIYPIVGIYLLATSPAEKIVSRTSAVYLAGVMFLPQALDFDLPGLPGIGKFEITPMVCLIGTWLAQRSRYKLGVFFSGAALFIWLSVVGWFCTVATNTDTLFFGPTRLQGLRNSDAFFAIVTLLTSQGAAFFVGRAMHRGAVDIEELFRVFALMGLIQVPLILFELRMSPQLHRMVYGYSVLQFVHVKRSGGFKPAVFTSGGLHMAIFLFTTVAAAAILKKVRSTSLRRFSGVALPVLLLTMVLSKNAGATAFSLAAVAAIFLTTWKTQLRVAAGVVFFCVLYPYLRTTGTLDVYGFVEWVATHSAERAQSIEFRFINEDGMLARALERPWFGWGGYGRNFVWLENGTTYTIPDGAWIIAISLRGIVGLAGQFGMLGVPLLGWTKRLREWEPRQRQLACALVLTAAFCMLDLIPNGIFGPNAAYLAGAAAGVADGSKRRRS